MTERWTRAGGSPWLDALLYDKGSSGTELVDGDVLAGQPQMGDGQREIVRVVWKELGSRIQVIYADGESDRVRGSQLVAADIATDAGLTVVPTPEGMARWVKDPDVGDTEE